MRKTYEIVLSFLQDYFIDAGYDENYVADFFSNRVFKEIVVIRLANSNVVIRNKTDKSSHQTHIAITGDSIDFFYNRSKLENGDNETSELLPLYVSEDNLNELNGNNNLPVNNRELTLEPTSVTVGSRTQSQVQLSKKISENGEKFNQLRNGLYENDLMIFLKYRGSNKILAIGIKKEKYRIILPEIETRFDTFTYLLIPSK